MQLTPIQQLQKALNEAAHEKLEDILKEGCEVYNSELGKIVTVRGVNKTHYTYFGDGFIGANVLKDITDGYDNCLGFPINLDLIMAALEKKGFRLVEYKLGFVQAISFQDKEYSYCIDYTPLSSIPSETVKALLEIFKN